MRPQYSSRSIRNGAIKLLAQAAADGKIPPQTVSVMAKHKMVAMLADTTIRYVQDPVALARIHATDKATLLL